MNLEALRKKRNDLVSRMEAIAAGDVTEELAAEFDQADAEVKDLNAQIDRLEKVGQYKAHLETPRPSVAQSQLLEDHTGQGQTPRAPGGPEAKRDFENFGEFMHAVRFRPNDQRLEWQDGLSAEHRMDDGPSGGFAVPKQFIGGLRQVDPQAEIIRPRAEVIPAGSPPDAEVSLAALNQGGATPDNVYGGVSVDWIGEGDASTESSAKIREVSWKPHEVAGHVVVTDKLLRNWQAAGPLLERQLNGARMSAEDREFYKGNGVAKPQGIINSAAAKLIARGTANDVKVADLHAMIARAMGSNLVWVASREIMTKLLNLQDNSQATDKGQYIWQPSAREGEPDRLFGRPILWNQRSPALGSKGDLSLIDASFYVIKDGSGPFVSASEHVHFTNNKTVIKITWNVDGRPWLDAPFKGEDGFEVSPFVVLDVP